MAPDQSSEQPIYNWDLTRRLAEYRERVLREEGRLPSFAEVTRAFEDELKGSKLVSIQLPPREK
jgi:hypothetical protein